LCEPIFYCGKLKTIYRPFNDSIEIAKDGLLDFDETKGNERDAAIKSPPKGKQRILSSVSHHLSHSPIIYILCHVTGPGEGQRLTKAHYPTNQTVCKAY
jgi:hypothetical protein